MANDSDEVIEQRIFNVRYRNFPGDDDKEVTVMVMKVFNGKYEPDETGIGMGWSNSFLELLRISPGAAKKVACMLRQAADGLEKDGDPTQCPKEDALPS
jgi:hypothetical protein